MLDTNSPEFKDLLAAWVHALKVLDTKLHAHILAIAALQNSPFEAAAPFLIDAVGRYQKSPDLIADLSRKYDSSLQKWEQLSPLDDFSAVLASWLREYQLEIPKQT
jgi:hypothetical protein